MRKSAMLCGILCAATMAAADARPMPPSAVNVDPAPAAADALAPMSVAARVLSGEQVAASSSKRTAPTRKPIRDSNRFYMEQNGKQMTAKDFDAWMKARGIRVATGKPAKPKP